MSQILVSVHTFCKKPFQRSVCNNNILADFSYTCAGSRAAVTLGGTTATRGARCWNLLLAQLPISQTAPSGAPWGATLWTPHWVPVTPVMWSRWGEIVKEKEMRGESTRWGEREGGNINICPYCMERSVYHQCVLLVLWQSFMSASSPLSFVLSR